MPNPDISNSAPGAGGTPALPGNAVQLKLLPSKVALVTLDLPDSKVNLLSESLLREFNDVLDQVQADKTIKGLVLTSGKADSFIAGASVNEIQALQNQPSAKAYEGATLGKAIMDKLESLPFPTVAAINGTCLGGGTELVLACKYRIASQSPKTKIALPEVKLGFIPGWGGTYRLPRLIGIQQGLTLITTGSEVDAKKAWRLGLVDETVPPDALSNRAEQIALKQDAKRASKPFKTKALQALLEDNPLGRKILASQALPLVKSKSKGYLAPLEAATVIIKSYDQTREKAMEAESRAFARLAPTSVSKNLVSIFFAQQASKRMPEDFSPPIAVRKVGVLGAGIMGAGIAQAAAYNGYEVVLKDIKDEFINKGMGTIKGLFDGLVLKNKLERSEADKLIAKIKATTNYADLADCDLVIEAVVEVMQVKQEALTELQKVITKPFIFASNTSSLSITTIGSTSRDPSSVVGLHFFNPVHKMPLVEVVRGEKTSDQTVDITRAFAMKLGKTAVTVRDAPGFVVNRILSPYMREAIILMQEGVPLEDIDRAGKEFGLPMGPLELLDEVGLDIAEKVIDSLHAALGERMAPPQIMPAIKALKIVGRKGGKGIYLYGADGKRQFVVEKKGTGLIKKSIKRYTFNPDVLAAVKAPRNPKTLNEIRDRLVLIMVNEACRVLEEKVIVDPSQLDLAMIFGIGFPPFHGGVLRYADQLGVRVVAQKLSLLAPVCGASYDPAPILLKKAAAGQNFYKAV